MTFEAIEDRIIETLKGISSFKTVETYGGQLEAEIEHLPVRFPACFVVYRGSDFEWIDGPNHKETVEFSVLVCARSLRGNAATRKGGPVSGEYGAYEIVRDVLFKLTNKNFSLDIERLIPTKVSLVLITKTLAVYGIDFRTAYDTTFNWEVT